MSVCGKRTFGQKDSNKMIVVFLNFDPVPEGVGQKNWANVKDRTK